MKLKKYKSEADKVKEVAAQLKKVSQLYGFKLPQDPGIALAIVKFICKDFSFIDAQDIEEAFKMASLDKLNVDITSYGQALTIPMISKVIRAYRKAVAKPKPRRQSKKHQEDLNTMARLQMLGELEGDKPLRFYHFEMVRMFIYKFPEADLEAAIKFEMDKHREILESIQPQSKAQRVQISQELNQLSSIAKINAKVNLVTMYVKKNVIDYPGAKSRIKANEPIK